MAGAAGDAVGAERHQQDDADDEGEAGCDDDECRVVVEVLVGVVGARSCVVRGVEPVPPIGVVRVVVVPDVS